MRWLVIVVALASLAAQRPAPGKPEQYPGQSGHAEPPAGWQCEHQTTTNTIPPDHVCFCQMRCTKDEQGVEHWDEDNKCSVWCWAKDKDGKAGNHCACPHMGCSEGSM